MSGRERPLRIYQKSMDDLGTGYGKNSEPFVFLSQSFLHQKQL
jgi:hypothetical protein